MAKKKSSLLSDRMKGSRSDGSYDFSYSDSSASDAGGEKQGKAENYVYDKDSFEPPKVVINFDNEPKKQGKKKTVVINTPSRDDFASRFTARRENNTEYSKAENDDIYRNVKTDTFEDPDDKKFVAGDTLFTSEEELRHDAKSVKKYSIDNQYKLPVKDRLKKFFCKRNVAIIVSAALAVTIGVNRIPSLVYNLTGQKPKSEYTIKLNTYYKGYPSKMIEKYPNEDWDNDGLKNSVDNGVFELDSNYDGVIDSDGYSKSINEKTLMTFEDVVIETDTNNSGVTKILDYYVINDYKKMWANFSKEKGIPYIYHDNKWEKAEYKETKNGVLVYIPYDYCYVEFLSSESKAVTRMNIFGKSFTYSSFVRIPLNFLFTIAYPYRTESTWDIGNREYTTKYHMENEKKYVVCDATLGKYDLNSDDRYKKRSLNAEDLNQIYKDIDENRTSLISVQSDNGEGMLIIYGYDYLGNLYASDYQKQKHIDILKVRPSSRILSFGSEYKMYSSCEISGFNIDNSQNTRFVLVDREND